MMSFLRRFKISFALYNFFHRKELIHNEVIYKKLGIKKRYYSPVSSRDFEKFKGDSRFEPAEEEIKSTRIFRNASIENQQSLLHFNDKGYTIIRNYLSPGEADAINADIEQLLATGKVKKGYGGKIMFAIHHSEVLQKTGNDKDLGQLLNVLLGGNSILFQSINFMMGSEQDTHSDSIHMTTYPLGGLLGVWIALEDIGETNGPLHYYPGSHKLPYFLNKDYDNEGSRFMTGSQSYSAYERMIEGKIKELGIKKEIFKAKKGDMLIWHANLFHGGEAHTDKTLTRKSVVFHYFKENSICYHEITQRPALIKDFD